MERLQISILGFGLVMAMVACGGSVDHGDRGSSGETGGSGGIGSSSGGGGWGAEGPGGASSGGMGPGGAGGECAEYLDAPSPGEVQFVITNHRMSSVYIGDGACVERFQILVAGEPEQGDLTEFALTCAQVETNPSYPLDCDSFGTFEIAPGASTTVAWKGLVYEGRMLPPACAANPENPFIGNCRQGVVPPSDAELALQVELYGDMQAGEIFSVTQPFDPASGTVDVPIEP